MNISQNIVKIKCVLFMESRIKFNENNNKLLKIVWVMLFLGFIISIYFIISTGYDGYGIWGKEMINFTTTGQFGDFFGGVVGTLFGLSGTLLIILTFRTQSKQYEKEAFEAKFYEMLKLHSDNVREISVNNKHGRVAIEYLTKQLELIFNEVDNLLVDLKSNKISPQEIDTNAEVFQQIKNYINEEDKRLLLAHKLSYGYFFYGIQEYHITKDNKDIVYKINLIITTLIFRNRLASNEHNEFKADEHYNSILGHYYRHLFQILKLIANNNSLIEKEKYEFAKIVRAQLSDYEQILLYYNSLSVMGEKWSMPRGEKEIEKMCFIARFRMIKNIPYYFNYFGINPSRLFMIEKNVWDKFGNDFFETNLENINN